MINYKIIDSYKEITDRSSYSKYTIEIEDLKSNLHYSVWLDDYYTICFDRNLAAVKDYGYLYFLREACVFINADLLPYIYS